MKQVFFSMGLCLTALTTHAQVGVNTDTPQATLDIKSEGNTPKALKITNNANTEIVTVTDEGKVGIGASSPNTKLDVKGDVLIESNSKTETIFPLVIKNSGHLSSEILNQSIIGFTDKNDKLYAYLGEGSPSGKTFGFSTNDSYTAYLASSNIASVNQVSGAAYDAKNKALVTLAIFSADSPTENQYDLAFNISRQDYGANPPSTINKQSIIKGEQNGNISIGLAHSTKAKAKLDVNGYIKLGSADATADVTPKAGMLRYNTAKNKFQGYVRDSDPNTPGNQGGWIDLH